MNKLQLLAQNASGLGPIGSGGGFGPFTNDVVTTGCGALTSITKLVSLILGIITITAAVYFIVQLITGAFLWIIASADKNKLTAAQDMMIHGLIGIIIVIAAYSIAGIVGTLLGIDIFIEDPGALMLSLGAPC